MGAPEVLVLGEALVDIVETADGVTEHVGGSPANVAVGVARLGVPVRLVTRLGRDERGERIARHVRDAGAKVAEASWTDASTDTARARIRPDGSAEYEFDVAGVVPPVALDGAALVHTGSIALFLDPGGETCLAALEAARGDAIVTVDPNIRPALVGARETALARFARAAAAADLVKLSDEDAEWLWPGDDAPTVLETIARLGAAVVVMTRGGDGAIGRAPDGTVVEVAGVAVVVADTIGAGDSFMASLIATLVDRGVPTDAEALVRALRIAARAAAITVSRPGANPPTRAELED
ncbi:PfkB family carbohydrate kinase [Microbacterium arborescens]|uniref:PfkB family carbohydrate kinase n=1 Tax=Microbacterium arborescens TaxID=33883 RepID=UPI0025A02C76|nr:PfkB family carbohydrate kinase [Microbacterium arborescens]WJM15350.1 PfkB family carbohydrate kinase [Microbacterium arborescens]